MRNAGCVLLWAWLSTGAAAAPAAARAAGPATALLRQAVVGNATTTLSIEAGRGTARVAALQLRGQVLWRDDRSGEPPGELPDHVTRDGVDRALTWHWDRAASRFTPRQIELVYESDEPALRLVWRWRARAQRGPLEHDVRIENRGAIALWLPLVPSWRYAWHVKPHAALRRFWVEKGADTPSAQGTHDDPFDDGAEWEGRSSTYARPVPGRPREMIPYLLVHAPDGAALGWYVGLEFSGRTHITLHRAAGVLAGEAGLDPEPGPYRTRLAPHAVFTTPTVFLGAAAGGPDGAGNELRRWVRDVLGNPRTLANPRYPLLVSNSWGSGMAVDAALAERMIVDARALGLEMFHLDAGWFRGVGDWRADPHKFPLGVGAIADFAHRRGLAFGLWVDWTQAGVSANAGALDVANPLTRDWLIADPPPGWKHAEEFKGITTDLGVPAFAHWAAREVDRIVTDNRLDMLEHDGYLVAQGSTRTDHPAAPPDPATLHVTEDSGYVWVEGSNSTDVSDYATRAYYSIYAALRRRRPQLLLEICNDGGRMVDFGSAAHGDYFSITDTYDPLANRRAFYDASWVLPPAMLETYVEKWPAPRIENFRYMLRSGMQGWFSLMQDANGWTPAEREAAREEFALYKSALRPLIRDADLYHVGDRPDGVHWDGTWYFAPGRRRGVLFAFRGSDAAAPSHAFRLRGLDPDTRYRLRFHDHGGRDSTVVMGRALMADGLRVSLPEPLSSELVFLEEER